jgi:serine/threonine-protein kinase
LQGRLVVIGNSTVASDGVRTPMAVTNGMALMVATSLANLLDGSGIRRPALLPWLELPLALLLSAAAVMAFRRLVPVAGILLGLGVGAALLLIEFGLFNGAGVWVKLASLAVFCPVAFAMLQVLERLPPAGRSVSERGAADAPGSGAQHGAELDLAFSYLRQQPVTDLTKQRLYELAMDHGRRRDYARAERVFRHLASRDPDYRDVADKLEKLSGARGQLQVPPVPESANAQAVPAADKDAQRTLGRYELERVLGRGAMATVYLGRDPTINRRVAIKTVMLATEFADSELATARATFRREAESSGRLNHPNIISIYDAGESNNVAYLAMEYFDGKPLSDFAQPGCLLPPRQVLDLMARAADALHYAHNQHVVHRDIKPGNLMYHPQTDTLKLTDFGIARLTDASRTRTGIVLGTPSYMSPEQLAGSKVTGLSDLYSLAVTMYHLLAGSPPFQADSIAKLMDKIAREPHRPVREIRDDLPACVDAVLDRALAKNPSDRYPSGHAMAFAIRECCNSVRANE